MGTEEAAAVAVEVDMAGAVTVVLAVRRGERQQSDQRRRTSWISRSTWTSASPSSLMADGKVCCHAPVYLLPGKRKILTAVQWHAVTGVLKGYDALMNLVLDDVKEALRGEDTERGSPGLFPG